MSINLAIYNSKGGVGKTTTSKAIAGELARRGYSVLLVDCDSSANTTGGIAHQTTSEMELAQLIIDSCDENFLPEEGLVQRCICQTDFQNLFLMPASTDTMKAADAVMQASGYHKALRDFYLPEINDFFDFIIFDTREGEGEWKLNVLNAADYLICPAAPEVDDVIIGYSHVKKEIDRNRENNPNLNFLGLFLTKYSNDRNDQDMLDFAMEQTADHFIPVVVRYSKVFKAARVVDSPVCFFKADSNPSIDYASLTDYLLGAFGLQEDIPAAEISAFDVEKLLPSTLLLLFPGAYGEELAKQRKSLAASKKELNDLTKLYTSLTGESPEKKEESQGKWLSKHDAEYKALLEQVRKHGITEPVLITPRGADNTYMVLDGRKRRDIAVELGINLPVEIIWQLPEDEDTAQDLFDLVVKDYKEKIDCTDNEARKLVKLTAKIKEEM